jgi:hypothetical protein
MNAPFNGGVQPQAIVTAAERIAREVSQERFAAEPVTRRCHA